MSVDQDLADPPAGCAECEQLRKELQATEALVQALQTRQQRIIELLVGEEGFEGIDEDERRDIDQRILDLEESVGEVQERVRMVRNDGGADSPDDRARRLRQRLYEGAKQNGGKYGLTRDSANEVIGGGYHRSTVLDVMRRAADGKEADINGSTDLEPIDGIQFEKGTKMEDQSRITIDLSDITGSDLRWNLTTVDGVEGGQR